MVLGCTIIVHQQICICIGRIFFIYKIRIRRKQILAGSVTSLITFLFSVHLPGQTDRQRQNVLNLSVRLSFCYRTKLVNTVFWKWLNRFWCQLAQMFHGAVDETVNFVGQDWGGQRSRSHEAEDRFGDALGLSRFSSFQFIYAAVLL